MSHRSIESHIERPITIAGRLKDGIVLSEILAEVFLQLIFLNLAKIARAII